MSTATLAPPALTLTADDVDRLRQGLLSIENHLGYLKAFAQLDLDEACVLGCAQYEITHLLEALSP